MVRRVKLARGKTSQGEYHWNASAQVSSSIPEARGSKNKHTDPNVDASFHFQCRQSKHLGEPLGASGGFGGISGASGCLVAVSAGLSWTILRHLWVILWPLGLSWSPFGPSLSPLGRLGGLLGPSWAAVEPFGGALGPAWRLLGPSWAVQGLSRAILKPSWGLLGLFVSPLTPSWGDFGGHSGRLEGSKR